MKRYNYIIVRSDNVWSATNIAPLTVKEIEAEVNEIKAEVGEGITVTAYYFETVNTIAA
jgi:hypothetical protein